MAPVVADTHSIIWYLNAQQNLSLPALTAMRQSVADGDAIYISAITIIEIIYLVEKGRLPPTALTDLNTALQNFASGVSVVAVDALIAQTLQQVPRHIVPDMPDRIITATALHLKLPLVTRDHKIQAAQIVTIW